MRRAQGRFQRVPDVSPTDPLPTKLGGVAQVQVGGHRFFFIADSDRDTPLVVQKCGRFHRVTCTACARAAQSLPGLCNRFGNVFRSSWKVVYRGNRWRRSRIRCLFLSAVALQRFVKAGSRGLWESTRRVCQPYFSDPPNATTKTNHVKLSGALARAHEELPMLPLRPLCFYLGACWARAGKSFIISCLAS